jgi:hypothetical protein
MWAVALVPSNTESVSFGFEIIFRGFGGHDFIVDSLDELKRFP